MKRKYNGRGEEGRGKKSRGWTLPGYNFLGPGNDLDNAVPTDRDDYIAQDHDYDYQDLESAGINPYITYSEADDIAMKQFGHGYGGNIGKATFMKKKILAAAGVLKSTQFKKRHHYILKKQSNPKHHFIENVAKGEDKKKEVKKEEAKKVPENLHEKERRQKKEGIEALLKAYQKNPNSWDAKNKYMMAVRDYQSKYGEEYRGQEVKKEEGKTGEVTNTGQFTICHGESTSNS